MKSYSWIVEVLNPKDIEQSIWFYSGDTLEKVCNEWKSQTGNTFLNYHKLHNIHHNRNKGDTLLIKVKKVKQNVSQVVQVH